MITFTLDTKEYSLPETWAEVPYSKTQRLIALDREDNLDEYSKAAKIISIFSGIDYTYLTTLKATDVFKLFHLLNFLDERATGVIKHFSFSGDTYYVNDLEDEVYKAFVMYHRIEKTFEEEPEKVILYKMALLCRKIGETVEDMDARGGKVLEERAALFNQLPSSVVQQVDAFFLSRWVQSETVTHLYSQALKRHQGSVRNFLATTTKSGGGKGQRTGWLTGTLQKFILSMTRKRAKSSLGWNGK